MSYIFVMLHLQGYCDWKRIRHFEVHFLTSFHFLIYTEQWKVYNTLWDNQIQKYQLEFVNHTWFILTLIYKILKFRFHSVWHFLDQGQAPKFLTVTTVWNDIYPRCLTRKNQAKEENCKPWREPERIRASHQALAKGSCWYNWR